MAPREQHSPQQSHHNKGHNRKRHKPQDMSNQQSRTEVLSYYRHNPQAQTMGYWTLKEPLHLSHRHSAHSLYLLHLHVHASRSKPIIHCLDSAPSTSRYSIAPPILTCKITVAIGYCKPQLKTITTTTLQTESSPKLIMMLLDYVCRGARDNPLTELSPSNTNAVHETNSDE